MFTFTNQIFVRTDYAWVLTEQGRTEEAKCHLDEIQRLHDKVDRDFAHVNVDASLLARWNVVVGEEFEIRLDLVDISRKTGVLVKIEDLVPLGFRVIIPPAGYVLENNSVNLQEERIGPFEVKTIKLWLRASKPGIFTVSPRLTYSDEAGEVRTCISNQVTVTAKSAPPKFEVLPGRVTTGFEDLDALLFGGIPKGYAVALVSPWIDEKELLVQRFLEAGAEAGEIAFQVTTEAGRAAALAEKYPLTFFLLVCNPQADAIVPSLPNVFKLKGIESLTEVDIALTKAFRTLPATSNGDRRMCIEIVSDALLQHHALITRKWLSGLLPNLKSRGFTVLAVINSQMHRPEEVQAILSLFDGEVRIAEKETPQGVNQTLRVKRLFNQRFSDSEVVLDMGKLEQ
jgi:KaiC/GvpD/RAD55 family RecA-like ATPase